MQQLTGSLRLLRLALRRDRVRLGIWLLIIVGLIASVPPAVQEMYTEPGMREQYAATMTDSMVGRLYGGVLDGDSIGAVVMVESFTFTATLIAFMSALLVVRHTRANEETGAAEALHSTQLGRLAPVASALLLALLVNTGIALATGVLFLPYGEYPAGSGWLLGLVFMGVGMSFAALGALAGQISSSTRGANALVGGVIGISFALRGIGDAFASRTDAGQLESHWLAWLSPLGWGQQLYPFTRQEWPVLLLFVGFFVGMSGLSYLLLRQRDIGSGLLKERAGRAHAPRGRATVFGLAWYLQRAGLVWWLAIFGFLGVLYGTMAHEFRDMLDSSELMRQYIGALGGEGEIIRTFLGAMMAVTAIVVVGYAVTASLKLLHEEVSGRMETLYSTRLTRLPWFLSHLVIIAVGSALLLGVLGATTGYTASAVLGGDVNLTVEMTVAALAYWPAVMACLGVVLLAIGTVPSMARGLGWGLFIFLLVLSQLGALLKLPEWLLRASPFYHIPALPVETMSWPVFWVLIAIATAMMAMGTVAYLRRDMRSA